MGKDENGQRKKVFRKDCIDCQITPCIPQTFKGQNEIGRPFIVKQYVYQSKNISEKNINVLTKAIINASISGVYNDPFRNIHKAATNKEFSSLSLQSNSNSLHENIIYKKNNTKRQMKKTIRKSELKRLVENIINEMQNGQSIDYNMPTIIVGGTLEGEYTIGEIMDNFEIKGYVEPSNNPNLKIKLVGYPIIKGYIGPMWDSGKIRYESQDAYDFFSMEENRKRLINTITETVIRRLLER